jgi:DNA-binding GntR family transcriptional regulator
MVSRTNITHRSDLTPVAHREIVAAIVAGDVERAAVATAEHVEEATMMYAHESISPQGSRRTR